MQKKILSLVLGTSMLLGNLLPASADIYTTKLQGTNTATMKDGSIISVDSDDFSMEEIEYHIIDSTDGAQSANVYAKIASTYSVTIPKVIVLKGVKGSASTATYKIDVDGDIAGNEYILVEPDYTAPLHQGGKADVNMDITQNLIKYRANNYTKSLQSREVKIANTEDVIADGEGEGTVSATLTAGKWTGVFNFNIKLMQDEDLKNINLDIGRDPSSGFVLIKHIKADGTTNEYNTNNNKTSFSFNFTAKKGERIIINFVDINGNPATFKVGTEYKNNYTITVGNENISRNMFIDNNCFTIN